MKPYFPSVFTRLRCPVLLLALTIAFSGFGAQLQALDGHVPPSVKALSPVGQLAATNRLNLAISLPLRNAAALSNLLRQIYDPASPAYHHYLTPSEFTARFGPTQTDYQAIIAFAEANHLKVTAVHPNRLILDVSGTVPEVEKALHVTLHTYRHPTEQRLFYAPDREPALALSVPVLHISGLDNYALPRPRLHATPVTSGPNASPNTGSGPGGAYLGLDFRAAYVPDTTLDGSGQAVGLLQFDGYTASDITAYETLAGLPDVPLQNVLVDGASGDPSGTGGEVEVSLDIEMSISMATNLSKVIVYMAPNPSPFVDLLSRMANDNLAKQLSCSWYMPNGPAEPAADVIFLQMAAQGQSFFCASGDYDAYTGLIDFPSDDPYVTEVGGTMLTTTGPHGARVSETVWNRNNGIGSGGGISTQYPIPSWQTNISMAANLGSMTMRNIPDVALTAESVYVEADGLGQPVGGTSCASPLWAGFMALVNQQAARTGQPPVGFLNPALDAIGTSANYATAFNDITTGNNTSSSSPNKFYAVAGYDLCTGWGTPAGQKLINALANPEALLITPSAGFAALGGVGGPFTITAQGFSLTNVGTNTLTWTLSDTPVWLNASSLSGTLTPGGAAATVTVSFNAAASNLMVGTYSATLWFTNLNDNVGQSRQFTLSVISPPSITQQPVDQAVLEGATAGFGVQVTGGLPLFYQWQYNGTNLTDGGNVSGSATSNLTISAVCPAEVGTYSVVVTNYAGAATSSNAVLSITPSGPVIVSQPANQTAVIGTTAQFSLGVLGNQPFTFQWSFDGTNIVGATNAILTLTDVQFTNVGSYAVSITNSLGSVLSSNAMLTVITCDPAPSGLTAWWQAEGNAQDSVGTNNGVLAGTAGFAPGEVGQAFSLDGSSGYVMVPASPALDVGTASAGFTVEGWIQSPTITAEQMVVEWHTSGYYGGVQLQTGTGTGGNKETGGLYANLVDTGFNVHYFASGPNVLVANQFQHVALTYDKTTGIGTLYVNGAVVAQANLGIFTPETSFDLYLGRHINNGLPLSYAGLLDEFALYSRPLSAGEIQAIYAVGSGGKCPRPPVITQQPAAQTVAVGGTATFQVVSGGSPTLYYQWSLNQTNLVNATNSTLTLTNVQLSQAGNYSVLVANPAGSTNSAAAELAVGTVPSITTQPLSCTNLAGTAVTFSVTAGGTPPLSYQWLQNGTNIPGATGTNLNLASVQWGEAGSYTVLVTNAFGSTTSSNAVLTVLASPIITVQPTDQTVYAGSAVQFAVGVVGTTPFAYQWSCNETNLLNATNAVLTLADVQFTNAGNYSVSVANLYGSTNSATAVLSVNPAPLCDPAPSGLTAWWQAEGNAQDSVGTNNGVLAGTAGFAPGEVGQAFSLDGSSGYVMVPASPALDVGTASAGFTVEGWIQSPTITAEQMVVEWHTSGYYGGVQLQTGTGTGGNKETGGLYANLVDTGFNVHYFASGPNVLVANQFQHVALTYDKTTGIGTLYVNGAVVAQANLGIFTPETSFDLYLGRHINNGLPLSYAGLLDEFALYSRPLSAGEIQAIYAVGSGGKCPRPPVITQQPAAQTVAVGGTATFQVVSGGSPTLYYQWSLNQTNLVNATNSTLTLTNVQLSQAGNYSVLVANPAGSTNSAAAELAVGTVPSITTQPLSCTNLAGTAVTFSVTAGGTPPLSYQWLQNGTNIPGATGTNLNLASVQWGEAGSYTVLVTNAFGSTTSSNAVLTVLASPIITVQPTDQTVYAGSAVQFAVGVVGTTPFAYQWSCNETNLLNATNAVLTLADVQFTNAGNYSVSVANLYGSTNSATAVLSVNPAPLCDPAPSGLTAWWQAEGNAQDSVGTNNGVLAGTAGFAPGEVGQAFSLDGSSGYVMVPASPALDVGTASAGFTVEGWIQSPTITAEQMVVEWHTSGYYGGVQLQTGTGTGGNKETGGLYANLVDTGFNVHYFASGPNVLVANQFQHVALTYDKTTGIGTLYVNGAVVAQANLGIFTPETSFDLYLGRHINNGLPLSYAGLLDEFALYSRPLSAGEIQAIYSAGSNGKCPRPPILFGQPTNQSVKAGGTATFQVVSGGSPTLFYQWSFNRTNLANATNATLTLRNLQWTNTGNYSVVVANAAGSTNSATAVLTVQVGPSITGQPASQAVIAGSGASFSVAATGTAPLNYQWHFNGGSLIGATNSVLALSNAQPNNGGVYSVVVTNLYGLATSSNALLTVLQPPSITLEPTNQFVRVGSNVVLAVAASGTAPLNWQWLFQGTNLWDSTNICGLQSSVLIISNAMIYDTGNYLAVVTNNYGSATSSVAVLAVGEPPHIISGPASHSAPLGCTVSFCVEVSGALAAQWWKDGSPLDGQTNTVLTVSDFQSADLGSYQLVVTNWFGSVTSSPAVLSVGYHPPVAGADVVERFAAGGLRVNVADLLANDVDTNGDSLTIIGVSPNSAAGGTVGLTNNWVYYAPPAGWTNSDLFTYTVSDGLCGTDVGTVSVQVMANNPQPTRFSIGAQGGGLIQLTFTGIPGDQYQIEYADNLVNPNWQVLTTLTVDSFSICQFTDTSLTNTAARYYRAKPVLVVPLGP